MKKKGKKAFHFIVSILHPIPFNIPHQFSLPQNNSHAVMSIISWKSASSSSSFNSFHSQSLRLQHSYKKWSREPSLGEIVQHGWYMILVFVPFLLHSMERMEWDGSWTFFPLTWDG